MLRVEDKGKGRDKVVEEVCLKVVDSEILRASAVLVRILAECVYQPTDEMIDAILTQHYNHPRAVLVALCASGQCVAVAGIRHSGDGSAQLMHIAVAPASRGRGFGRMLVDRLIREQGLREVMAETDAGAVGFYLRCGFTIESLGEKYPRTERFLCRWRSPNPEDWLGTS